MTAAWGLRAKAAIPKTDIQRIEHFLRLGDRQLGVLQGAADFGKFTVSRTKSPSLPIAFGVGGGCRNGTLVQMSSLPIFAYVDEAVQAKELREYFVKCGAALSAQPAGDVPDQVLELAKEVRAVGRAADGPSTILQVHPLPSPSHLPPTSFPCPSHPTRHSSTLPYLSNKQHSHGKQDRHCGQQ